MSGGGREGPAGAGGAATCAHPHQRAACTGSWGPQRRLRCGMQQFPGEPGDAIGCFTPGTAQARGAQRSDSLSSAARQGPVPVSQRRLQGHLSSPRGRCGSSGASQNVTHPVLCLSRSSRTRTGTSHCPLHKPTIRTRYIRCQDVHGKQDTTRYCLGPCGSSLLALHPERCPICFLCLS